MDINYINYTKDNLLEKSITDMDSFQEESTEGIEWLDISNWTKDEELEEICRKLNIHNLVVEDILDENQRTKVEDYKDYIFIIGKIMGIDDKELTSENISFILSKNKLITFRKRRSDIFEYPIKRLKEGSLVRGEGSDGLLYILLDSLQEEYFDMIEDFGELVDDIEDELLINPSKEVLEEIYMVKRNLIYVRKSLWSMRNMISYLMRDDNKIIDEKTMYYIRSLYDDALQMIDLVETYREVCSGMLDTYLSSIGNKTNDVMKVLTIFSTIFIPITCIAGIYGMNFNYMPLLNFKYGYLLFWLMSILITLYMLRYFKKKDWI